MPLPNNRRQFGFPGSSAWRIEPVGDPPRLLRMLDGQQSLGYAEIDWLLPDAIANFGVLVEPPYRGQGLGTALIRALLRTARRYRVRTVEGYVRHVDLLDQPFLLHWYAREGFLVLPGDSVISVARLLRKV